jgi:putative oxidoreductase
MLKRLLSPSMWLGNSIDLAALILRLTLGLLMLIHGLPKLMKIIGGDLHFGNPIGIGEIPSLFLVVFAEVFCSILLVIGLWTRLAIIPLVITMLVAVFLVLLPMNAPIDKIESVLHFLIPYFALFLLGSGRYSIDAILKGKV